MFNQAQALRQYLQNRQEVVDMEKLEEQKSSTLYNDKTFYKAFIDDLLQSKKEVIIYSPFASKFRTDFLKQTIERLRKRNIEVFIFTRPITDYESIFQSQIECALRRYEELGACVYYLSGSIHEKLAIVDREILWEGSLNILSQRSSKEVMRRTKSDESAKEMMNYLGLNKKLAEGYKTKYEIMHRSLMTRSGNDRKVKTRVFFIGFGMAMLLWWIFLALGGMISLFRWVEPILKLLYS